MKTTEEMLPSPVQRGITAGQERTEFYTLCYANLPNHRKLIQGKSGSWNGIDVGKISNEIGVSRQKISGWFKDNKLPGQQITNLIDLEGSTLTFALLKPFVNVRKPRN